MEIANIHHGDSEFSWISRILPSIYPRFFQDHETNDKAPSEGRQVYLDVRLQSSFPAVEVEAIQLEPDLTYQEHPIKILDQKERATRRRTIKSYKVQWSNHSEEEATWETEDYLRAHYPEFLPSH